MSDELLKLPLQVQLALAGGYAAYLLAYVGIRDHHTTVEVTFRSLIFSLIVTGSYYLLNKIIEVGVIDGIGAFLICCVSGVLWRRFGREVLRKTLRYLDVSWSDDDPSALASLLGNSTNRMSQLAVLLEDDSWLICDDIERFENSAFGPCKLGSNGDVALYVTHIQKKAKFLRKPISKPQTFVQDKNIGDSVTYVPASKIKYIKFRYK